MPKDNRIYDGAEAVVAVDTDTSPSYLPPTYDAVAVNRFMRGGIRKTRPPFSELKLLGNADVIKEFQTGNFQGACAYSSIKYGSQDGIVCSVAGKIYFLLILNNAAYVTPIGSGNDPDLMHTWFVQAEDWLYIQNGKNVPQAWNGLAENPTIKLLPLNGQMPIGTIMEYAHGRVWVTDRKNNIYASDIIFGNGFTETSNTQNFTEQTYWAEGGSFTPPGNLGQITGARVMPYLGGNVRGQGELVILCQNGAFSLDGSIPRTDWIDAGIQRTTLIGRGCVSPWSVVSVNNEIMFRASDGWSLFRNAQGDFSSSLSFRNLSREMSYWTNQDTPWLRQFASAMYVNNLVVCTVSPYTERAANGALHRPHRGLIILDLDQTTPTAPDAGLNFRWNGLWTGPRPTQVLSATIRGEKRGFVFSFDADGKNRLYELKRDGMDDYVDGKSKKIKSYFITKRYDFAGSEQTNRFYDKQINGGDMWLSNIGEQVKVSASYRPDSYPCWNQLAPEITIGCDECDKEACDRAFSEPRQKRIRIPSPKETCAPGRKLSPTIGAEFQVLVEMEGSVTIDRLRISADTRNNMDSTADCAQSDTSCEPIECCPINDFEYYKLVE